MQGFARGDCSRHPLYQSVISPTIVWRKCSSCGHIFTEGYFTAEAQQAIFSKTSDNQTLGVDVERQRYVSARMVEKVLPYADDGIWLDVGFGNGSLLFTAQEYGFTPVGIDLRQGNVDRLKAVGIEARCVDISKLQMDRLCRVVSMADVLEHMPFPGIGLEAAKRLTASGGILLISMPNIESIVWTAMDATGANPYWGELEHYHNFGRARLYGLLREYGFEPIRYGISERYRACMQVIARNAD